MSMVIAISSALAKEWRLMRGEGNGKNGKMEDWNDV